jgi:ABC-type multidrug transport system ATPase subunit
VLFLDEPTTGLDPRSRNQIWTVVRELVEEGTTVFLTTQYLEEADQLASRIAVIDHGQVIAQGTGDELKDQIGGQMVQVRLVDAGRREAAERALARVGCGADHHTGGQDGLVTVPAPRDGVAMVAEAAAALRDAGVEVSDLALRRPTLDDVFLELTGREAAPEDAPTQPADDAAPDSRRPEAEKEPV